MYVPKDKTQNDDVACAGGKEGSVPCAGKGGGGLSFVTDGTALWLGLEYKGSWVDINGTAATYTNWYVHADHEDDVGKCAIVDTREEFLNILGAWWMTDCTDMRPFVCEL